VEKICTEPIHSAKLYFFDLGVARYLSKTSAIQAVSPAFGYAFEHFMFCELKAAQSYGLLHTLHYWRSSSDFEVDFLLDERWAIEVKAASTVRSNDLKGLAALSEEIDGLKLTLVYTGEQRQRHGRVSILPWREFLQELW
jgi:predicted AAA+ superfamily ATPase